MTQWQVGDTAQVLHRNSAQDRDAPCAPTGVVSVYRVTAVRGERCYVSHVSGPRFAHGIRGWDNLWFDASDAGVERVI